MTIHVYHPYRQPDGVNFCQAVNGHCSHLCLPAPKINDRSPRISCACPTGLKLMDDNLMCVEDGKSHSQKQLKFFFVTIFYFKFLFFFYFRHRRFLFFLFMLFLFSFKNCNTK